MKNIIIIFLIGTISINAQNIVEDQQEKSFDFSRKQNLLVNFKFAEDIKVEQWNKNEILIKVSYTIDDGKGNKHFNLKTRNNNSTLEIYSDFGNYYKNRNRKYLNYHRDSYNSVTKINYTLYVPKDIKFEIKSISGSVYIDEFKGKLTTDLISGDVTIKKYTGDLQLKTISGDLDVVIIKAKIKAKTLTGTIYSNLNFDIDKKRSSHSSHNIITGNVNNGNQHVDFNTISGNIYMRKL